jgi:CheY-like chemotaxis protein
MEWRLGYSTSRFPPRTPPCQVLFYKAVLQTPAGFTLMLKETHPDDSATLTVAPGGKPEGPRETVLVVEDSRTISSVLKHFLEREGFTVLVAADGVTGLETAKREHPHVIVTDCNMPGMDGMAMVRELRADLRTRGIAILVMTAESSAEAKAQALADGADDYIVKPIEPKGLGARVKAVLTRSKTRGPVQSA